MKQIEEIKMVIKSLELLPGIDDEAINNAALGISAICSWSLIDDCNFSQSCGTNQAIKELSNFQRKATVLHNIINSMHKTSLDELRKCNKIDPIKLELNLKALVIQSYDSILELQKIPDKQKTKPKKKTLNKALKIIEKYYKDFTGKEPNKRTMKDGIAVGEYQLFLQAIFDCTINKETSSGTKKSKKQKSSADSQIKIRRAELNSKS